MLPIKVPNFGINYSSTFTTDSTNDFRPAATGITKNEAIKELKDEYVEEYDMLRGFSVRNKFFLDNISHPNYQLLDIKENMEDTTWYTHQKEKSFVNLHKVLSYDGTYTMQKDVLIPYELFFFMDKYDTKNRNKLHWSNSGGFVHDKSLKKAISKGISETIENDQKMLWWFNGTNLIKLIGIELLHRISLSDVVENASTYLIDRPQKIGSFVCMTIIQTKTFPYVSMGFAADYDLYRSINHSIMESIHYYRGANWYALQGYSKQHYLLKNLDIIKKIKNSVICKKNISLISKKLDLKQITKDGDFLFGVINTSNNEYTVRVVNLKLQQVVSNIFVPFVHSSLATKENNELRQKYHGSPFE